MPRLSLPSSLFPPPTRPDVPVSAEQLLPRTEEQESTPLTRPPEAQRKCGIVMQRADYYTVPSLDELDQQAQLGKDLVVQDFTVGRRSFGKVRFLGPTCVSGLNLDELGEWKQTNTCGGEGRVVGYVECALATSEVLLSFSLPSTSTSIHPSTFASSSPF